MNKFDQFNLANQKIRQLDSLGKTISSNEMVEQYRLRNSFRINQDTIIHRIFQKEFYDNDISNGYLTLPLASSNLWMDPLENPLSNVIGVDSVTGMPIDYGYLVRSYYALCWTKTEKATALDLKNFSHGKQAIRISTTVRKLMERLLIPSDNSYMHRTWLVEVDYQDQSIIKALQNEQEVVSRITSSGELLAASAAIVRTDYSNENEIRLLFDASFLPNPPNITFLSNQNFIRIPFDWNGFVDKEELFP